MRQLNVSLFCVIQKYLLAPGVDQLFYILHPSDVAAAIDWKVHRARHFLDLRDRRVVLRVSRRKIKHQNRIRPVIAGIHCQCGCISAAIRLVVCRRDCCLSVFQINRYYQFLSIHKALPPFFLFSLPSKRITHSPLHSLSIGSVYFYSYFTDCPSSKARHGSADHSSRPHRVPWQTP